MKVYLTAHPQLGRAIHRVSAALTRHAPSWVEVVADRDQAEFEIIHVLGDGERKPLVVGLETGVQRPYALVQYMVRTTETPHTRDWHLLWSQSQVTWSYYDLPVLMQTDGVWGDGHAPRWFYHAPLGLDPGFRSIQAVATGVRPFLVGTSGYIAETEGIPEWAEVCRRRAATHFHLGPRLTPEMFHLQHIPRDEDLAMYWSACDYVAAMRRVEGFEFPGIEGLSCGARPVCFGRPHYRQWYGEHAEYVDEGTPAEVIDQLMSLTSQPPRGVTPSEITWVRETFDWARLCAGFWNRIEGARR